MKQESKYESNLTKICVAFMLNALYCITQYAIIPRWAHFGTFFDVWSLHLQSLDFGSSFMDEVMKAFSDVKDQDKTPTEEDRPLVAEDKSTLLSDKPVYSNSTNGTSTFDNFGLDEDYTSSSTFEPHETEDLRRTEYGHTGAHSPDLDGSSRSSSSATLGSDSDDVPVHTDKKKTKPRLRIVSNQLWLVPDVDAWHPFYVYLRYVYERYLYNIYYNMWSFISQCLTLPRLRGVKFCILCRVYTKIQEGNFVAILLYS